MTVAQQQGRCVMATLFDDIPPSEDGPYGRPPSQRHSPTSVAAAEQVEPHAGTLRARVLEEIRRHGADGATDENVQDALWINPSTERPRRIECVEAGLVIDSGRTRPTRSGRAAAVWIAKEFSNEGRAGVETAATGGIGREEIREADGA